MTSARPRIASAIVALTLGSGAAGCRTAPRDLSTEQLSAVIEQNRPALKACYDQALEKNPYKHEIRIQAAIHIEPSGRVSEVELDQSGLPGLGKCLVAALEGFVFPSAPEATRTSLPLVFQPTVVKTK